MENYQEILTALVNASSQLTKHPLFQIAIIILGAIIAQKFIRRYISRIITKTLRSHKYSSESVRKKRQQTLASIIGTAAAVIVWVITVVLILSALNVNIAALATGAGLIGVVVGFGAQSSIKDFLSGIFIILEDQYHIDDIIEIAGKVGVVEDITIRITRLRDLDGAVHIIPNGIIDSVTNMTFQYANALIDVSVTYDTDIDKVIDIINDVGLQMTKSGKFKDDIIEPIQFFRVDKFGDSAIVIKCLGKVAPGQQWNIAGNFRQNVKIAFHKNKIKIPLPQQIIYTKNN